MLLDYKLNKNLTKVGDILYKDVISYMGKFTEVKLTAKRMTDLKRCCYCIILNTASMINKVRPYITLTLSEESYSNPAVYNGNNTGRKISYTNMKIVLSYLENFTNSIIEKGGVVEYGLKFSHVGDDGRDKFKMVPKSFEASKLYLDESLITKVVEVCGSFKPTESVLEVRNEDGKAVGTSRQVERQKKLDKLLERNK